MALEHGIASLFRMDDATWERHANPLSVWTRVPVLPLLALAVWSRVWIGGWCFVPIFALFIWTWVNPRVFPRPASTENWASKAVMGERVWLVRKALPIPTQHARAAQVLSWLSALAMMPLAHGLWVLNPWTTAIGVGAVLFAKLWFLDRMVWLYEDMAREHETYAGWLR